MRYLGKSEKDQSIVNKEYVNTYCPWNIGQYYISDDPTSPAEIYPGTEWEQVKDCAVYAAGDHYSTSDVYVESLIVQISEATALSHRFAYFWKRTA